MFLIFGFLTLIGSLIYCVIVCKDVKSPKEVSPEDLYWTHHWQKHIGSPEIHYKAEDKYPDDRYSDHYYVSKYSAKYSDRDQQSDRYWISFRTLEVKLQRIITVNSMFQFVLKCCFHTMELAVYKTIFIKHICYMPDLTVKLNSVIFWSFRMFLF